MRSPFVIIANDCGPFWRSTPQSLMKEIFSEKKSLLFILTTVPSIWYVGDSGLCTEYFHAAVSSDTIVTLLAVRFEH